MSQERGEALGNVPNQYEGGHVDGLMSMLLQHALGEQADLGTVQPGGERPAHGPVPLDNPFVRQGFGPAIKDDWTETKPRPNTFI